MFIISNFASTSFHHCIIIIPFSLLFTGDRNDNESHHHHHHHHHMKNVNSYQHPSQDDLYNATSSSYDSHYSSTSSSSAAIISPSIHGWFTSGLYKRNESNNNFDTLSE